MPLGSAPAAVQSEEDVYRTAYGVKSWNLPPLAANLGPSAFVSQTGYAVGVPYRAGQVVTNIGWVIATAAVGAAPTGMFVGICSAATMLMDSTNLAGNANWLSAGFRTFPLTTPLTIPADGLYYHLLLQNGAFATTQPANNRMATPAGGTSQINAAGVLLIGTIGAALATLPVVNAAVTVSAAATPLAFLTFST